MTANLPAHSEFPWLASNVTTKLPTQCQTCPLAGVAGHVSCGGIQSTTPAPEENRIDARELRHLIGETYRRAKDAEGFYEPDFTAMDGSQWTEAHTYEIISVSGDEITLDYSSDPLFVKLASKLVAVEGALFPVSGGGVWGMHTPGDLLDFNAPSAARHTQQPSLRALVSVSGTEITWKLDQQIPNAMTADNDDDPDPVFTVRILSQAGNPEHYHQVNHATYMKARQRVVVLERAELPEGGLHTLAETAVAHPPGFAWVDEPVWQIEGWNGSTWEVLGDADNRLFVQTLSAGVYRSTVALEDTLPEFAFEGHATLSAPDVAYTRFRITFWQHDPNSCKVVCFMRCLHSRPDYSKSIHNSGATGTGEGDEISAYYCAERVSTTFDPVDTDEPPDGVPNEVEPVHTLNPGVANFPSDGQCLQYGTCPKFAASEQNYDDYSILQPHAHLGRIFQRLWGSSNAREVELMPGVSMGNVRVERIQSSSIPWLYGRLGMISPPAYQPLQVSSLVGGFGKWSTEPIVFEPSPGNFAWRSRSAYNYDLDTADPPAIDEGAAPVAVAGFETQRGQLLADAVYTMPEIERMGIRVEADTGVVGGRPFAAMSKTLEDATVIIPQVSVSATGVQERYMGSFERYAAPVEILGLSVGGAITIKPLKQESKTELSMGSREVHSVTSLGDNEWALEFTNVTHTWSYIDTGSDVVLSWEGGGGAPFYPPDYQRVRRFDAGDKTIGAPVLQPGDHMGVPVEGFTDWRFRMVTVEPHGGSEAAGWNGDTPDEEVTLDRVYPSYGKKRDKCIIEDATGFMAEHGASLVGQTVDFYVSCGVFAGTPTVEVGQYGVDAWAEIEDVIAAGGHGAIYIAESVLSGLTGEVCFRL